MGEGGVDEIALQHREWDTKRWQPVGLDVLTLKVPPTVYPPHDDTALLDSCIARLGDGSGRTMLEIGVGSGAVAIAAAQRGWQVTGCDVNPLAVAATLGNSKEAEVEITLLESGIGEGQSLGGPYDMVAWNLPYLSPPKGNEPRLGPLEDAGLVDDEGEGWGRMACDELFSSGLLKDGGCVLIIHNNNERGRTLQTHWRNRGWATRTVDTMRLGGCERITCFTAWKPSRWSQTEEHGRVSSTNQMVLDGDYQVGTLVTAKLQTQGRGQRNREWITRDGDFAGSWRISPKELGLKPGVAQLRASIAVLDALAMLDRKPLPSSHWSECTSMNSSGFGLAWPNDLTYNGRKFGGLLIESRDDGSELKAALGIGIDIEPWQGNQEWGSLADWKEGIELRQFKEALMISIASTFDRTVQQLNNPHLDESCWIGLAGHLSAGAMVSLEGETLRVHGIGSNGELLTHKDGVCKETLDAFGKRWVS